MESTLLGDPFDFLSNVPKLLARHVVFKRIYYLRVHRTHTHCTRKKRLAVFLFLAGMTLTKLSLERENRRPFLQCITQKTRLGRFRKSLGDNSTRSQAQAFFITCEELKIRRKRTTQFYLRSVSQKAYFTTFLKI